MCGWERGMKVKTYIHFYSYTSLLLAHKSLFSLKMCLLSENSIRRTQKEVILLLYIRTSVLQFSSHRISFPYSYGVWATQSCGYFLP